MGIAHRAAGACLIGLVACGTAQTEEPVDEERIIEHRLDTTQSRVLRDSDRPIERSQVERGLDAAEQRLRSLKTRAPQAESIPLLERQLDRLNRPARIRER